MITGHMMVVGDGDCDDDVFDDGCAHMKNTIKDQFIPGGACIISSFSAASWSA